MPKVIARLYVPTAEPDDTALEVRHIFRRFVQSSITPPITVETVPSGIVVDLDIRVYDNYRVPEAIEAVRAIYPDAQVLAAPAPDAVRV